MPAVLLVLAVIFSIGVAVGNSTDPDPDVEYRVIHDTETITETETVEVAGDPPPECMAAANLSKSTLNASQKIDTATSEILEILSQARVIAVTGDVNEANNLENQIRAIQRRTLAASETIGINKKKIEEAATACKEGN